MFFMACACGGLLWDSGPLQVLFLKTLGPFFCRTSFLRTFFVAPKVLRNTLLYKKSCFSTLHNWLKAQNFRWRRRDFLANGSDSFRHDLRIGPTRSDWRFASWIKFAAPSWKFRASISFPEPRFSTSSRTFRNTTRQRSRGKEGIAVQLGTHILVVRASRCNN